MNLAKGRCNNDIITLLEEAVLRWVELKFVVSQNLQQASSQNFSRHKVCCMSSSRRQNEIVTPMRFDAAVSGNADLLFTILENGDDVNPLVSYLIGRFSW